MDSKLAMGVEIATFRCLLQVQGEVTSFNDDNNNNNSSSTKMVASVGGEDAAAAAGDEMIVSGGGGGISLSEVLGGISVS